MVAISSQPNKADKLLFRKNKHEAISYGLAVFLSVLIMAVDLHSPFMRSVRMGLNAFVAPVQFAVDYPVRLIGGVHALIRSKKALLDENITLHYHQTILEAELQKLMAIKEENSQLKQLLLTSSKSKTRAMAAEILAVDTNPSRQILVLNKGSKDKVYIGQPVLDAKGVMGQIIDVGLLTSTVLLISDAKCAVPVQNNRTGERAILVGINRLDQMHLINLPRTSNIEVGDLLITSGLGRLYPEGYPVGRVAKITRPPGDDFMTIDVTPIAKLNQDRLVLLVWLDNEQMALNEQITERIEQAGKIG